MKTKLPQLNHFPFIIDGGLATELEAQGHNLNHILWSAKLILEDPQAIIDAHLAYLNAGAKCIISASYQASIDGFTSLGLSQGQAIEAIKDSVELARAAVDIFHKQNPTFFKPLVAASVGPYGAYLADGSEYTGKYGLTDHQLKEFHQQRLDILSATSADLLACETIPSQQEAKVLNQLISVQDKPAWLCFSCKNEQHISDGSLLSESVKLLENNPNIIALGINCTAPQYLPALIDSLSTTTKKYIIVYPNSGEHFHSDTKTWHGTADPQECAEAAKAWINAGASIIGGCCRMGPEHIKAISESN
ncbi:homocysteine S-methyltransferase [Thalassomonas sp. M1454]|uniref:homocysteine S-methyltransferase n=1 Tax=Thalassomonas sp. M1454 TaxID=2594477 RepID=UPI00117F6411|nr:homocysteine S-methyltransferase [Thalassomonas sp. M1454]TRX56776.1 homocysteine S-methyltransferase [Thalassomonas sp. M1454]